MIIPVTMSLSIQMYLKKLNYFLLEAGDEFKCQKRQFHGTFNLYNHDIWTRPVIMQVRKMADYNLLLVAIPEDTRKSEPINPKNKLKTLL